MSKLHQGSAFISTITYTNRQLAKLAKSLRHSLRCQKEEEENINYDREKSHLNSILFSGQSEEFMQQLNLMSKEEYLTYIDEVINLNVEKTEEVKADKKDLQMRSKSLKYLKDKINDTQFQNLLKSFNEEPNEKNKELLTNYFNSMDGLKAPQKKNFNKYINVVDKIGISKNRRDAKLSNVERTEFVEMVVKIPWENNQTTIKGEDMMLYTQNFFNRYFKDYDIVVSVSHNDELHQSKSKKNIQKLKDIGIDYKPAPSGYHSQTFINVKNNKTGKFDYWIQQHKVVREYLLSKGLSEEFIKKEIGYIDDNGVRKQNLRQIKNQGENLQDLIYEDINKELFNDFGYDAIIGFNNLTPDQKRSMEKEKTLSINKRRYNGHHLREKLLDEREEDLTLNENNIVEDIKNKYKEELSKNEELKNANNHLEEQSMKEAIEVEKYKNQLTEVKNELAKSSQQKEINNEIIDKQKSSIEKLKQQSNSIKSSKKEVSNVVKIEIEKILNADITTYKMLDKDKLKEELIYSFKKVSKLDIIDDEIQKYKDTIDKDKEEEIEVLKREKGVLSDKVKELENEVASIPLKIEEGVEEETKKINYRMNMDKLHYDNNLNDKNKIINKQQSNIYELEDKYEVLRIEKNTINKENTKLLHKVEELTNENSKLNKIIDKLNNKYNKFKDKVRSLFNGKNETIDNQNKVIEKDNRIVAELKETISIAEELKPGIKEEVSKYKAENLINFTPTVSIDDDKTTTGTTTTTGTKLK